MSTKAQKIVTYFVARLREPSSYAALAAMLALFGVITPEQQAQLDLAIPSLVQNLSLVASVVAAAFGGLLSEKKGE
jgi:hypothetical protein